MHLISPVSPQLDEYEIARVGSAYTEQMHEGLLSVSDWLAAMFQAYEALGANTMLNCAFPAQIKSIQHRGSEVFSELTRVPSFDSSRALLTAFKHDCDPSGNTTTLPVCMVENTDLLVFWETPIFEGGPTTVGGIQVSETGVLFHYQDLE